MAILRPLLSHSSHSAHHGGPALAVEPGFAENVQTTGTAAGISSWDAARTRGSRGSFKIDTNLLNQMSALASAQGYSLTNKVWQLCNGWLMEGKRANGSPAILYVEPKTQTIVDVDFTKS